jgi:hypothetical protein
MIGYTRSRREKYRLCRTPAWEGNYHRDAEQVYAFPEFLIQICRRCGQEPPVGFQCEEWGLCVEEDLPDAFLVGDILYSFRIVERQGSIW